MECNDYDEVTDVVTAATIVGQQYDLVRQIQKHLKYRDLSQCSLVSRMWLAAAQAGCSREVRRRAVAWLGWQSTATPQLHRHYEICGNNLLSYHIEAGVLKHIKEWIKSLDHRPHLVMAVGTGVAYIYYLITKNAHFILTEEVEAISKIHNLFPPNCSSLFLTSLRVLNPSPSQLQTLDFSLISIPKPTTNCEIRPFIVSDNELVDAQASIWKSNPLLTFDEVNIRIFEHVTNVPVDLMKGLVVLNTGDFTTIVWSVLDKVGSFPLAVAESEGLTCIGNTNTNNNMKRTVIPSSFSSNYSSHTSGLIMLGQDIKISSALLDVNVIKAESIKKKLATLSSENPKSSGRRNKKMTSLGIMLTTCMRGYDGVDINREHVELRNKLQKLEASTFKDMYPETELVAVQVEDVLGMDVPDIERVETGAKEKRPRWDENKENYIDIEKNEKDDILMEKEDEIFRFSDSSTVFIKIDY